jgi:transcriptional regulator with XRE-family HTH domain
MPTEAKKSTRRHAISSMEADRYRKLITKLGLSQRGAGRFLGVSDTQAARMALGTAAISPPIAMLLELLVLHATAPEDALKLIGVNVARAAKEARAEQVNKQPRFF